MDVVKRLQNHNIKPSVQRIAIMNYLIEHRTHPTVDEIYTALSPSIPTLSKTTVYNTLKLLSEQGAAQTLTIDERNTCYDADTSPHGHFSVSYTHLRREVCPLGTAFPYLTLSPV